MFIPQRARFMLTVFKAFLMFAEADWNEFLKRKLQTHSSKPWYGSVGENEGYNLYKWNPSYDILDFDVVTLSFTKKN